MPKNEEKIHMTDFLYRAFFSEKKMQSEVSTYGLTCLQTDIDVHRNSCAIQTKIVKKLSEIINVVNTCYRTGDVLPAEPTGSGEGTHRVQRLLAAIG